MRLVTRSEQETESLGETLASILQPGAIVGLTGPLGAGKTAFVRGIARGCGVAEGVVHSPTFLTAAEYEGHPNVTHLDLYRHEEMLPDADWLAEILDGDGIAVVEWFERLAAERPPESLEVSMTYGESEDVRVLEFRARGPRAEQVLGDFASRRAS